MTNSPIVLLGPAGATFTYRAYSQVAPLFDAPPLNGNIIEVRRNRDVLQTLAQNRGGFGLIAVETMANGRINDSLESFVRLGHRKIGEHTPHIIGAACVPLWFVLMSNGIGIDEVEAVTAHEQALEACSEKIEARKWHTEYSASNGRAAEDVATIERYKHFAALGPEEAAQKYGLRILDPHFQKGLTTFYLLSSDRHKIRTGPYNRALVIFRTRGGSGALRQALKPFEDHDINMRHVHSVHVTNGVYEFVAEIEARAEHLDAVSASVRDMRDITERCSIVGPFSTLDL